MSGNKPLIILSGGGTLGSVMPLLAVADELRSEYGILFVGTKKGPEKAFIKDEDLPFTAIHGGKWRRYWSWRNIGDLFLSGAGCVEAWWLLKKCRPSLVVTAGSYVSVPLVLAAWLLRIPVLVHQLDYRSGLANKLMAPMARVVTVSFEKSAADYGAKARWVGSPVRAVKLSSVSLAEAAKFFKLSKDRPVVLVLGGGTGAHILNRLIVDNLYNLSQICQIIHLTGRGKEIKVESCANYRQYSSLNQVDVAKAYAVADLVVSRAGMGVLGELAYLAKPAIIVPMPDSHQEVNAEILLAAHAAIVLDQKKLNTSGLYRHIKDLLSDQEKMRDLGKNLRRALKTDAAETLSKIIKEIID